MVYPGRTRYHQKNQGEAMYEQRDIQTVDARALFRIQPSVRRIVPCHGRDVMSTAV